MITGSVLRKFIFSLFLALFLFSNSAISQKIEVDEDGVPLSCTSIMVGRKATDDGSVITSHSCDGKYRTWLNIVPHRKHKEGAKRKIYWGTLFTESIYDSTQVKMKGEIPQVAETFSFLNVAYPCLNEKQLAIGESTTMGKDTLHNTKGLFVIEELGQIVLERCTTARQAIKLMGALIKEYGYGDYGECLTIADKKEVWQFEVFGEGPSGIGGVWAAQRIPDDHVGISANIPRIGILKLDNPDFYMASENVFEVAKKLKLWDGVEPFKFWKAYGAKKPFGIRDYYVLNAVAPSLGLKYDVEELPFSVKPDKLISVRDVFALYRTTFENSKYDMTKKLKVKIKKKNDKGVEVEDTIISPIANPWMSSDLRNLINTLKPETIERQRTVAITGCAYSQVIQVSDKYPDEIGGVAWFSFDNPAQSPRIPIFSGTLSLPQSFEFSMQSRYRNDAAGWWFREANRLSTVRWSEGRKMIEGAVADFENKAFDEVPYIQKRALELYKSGEKGKEFEKYREYLTDYTKAFSYSTMYKWRELSNAFWQMYGRGF